MALCQRLSNSGNNTKAPQRNTCENKVTDADTFCSRKGDVTQSQKKKPQNKQAWTCRSQQSPTTPTLVSMRGQVHEGSCSVNCVVFSNR